jgi:hypothetical protein
MTVVAVGLLMPAAIRAMLGRHAPKPRRILLPLTCD